VGTASEGADAYPPLLLYKCLRPLHNLRKATGRLSFYPKIPLKISLK
jgi:hypothetical protein